VAFNSGVTAYGMMGMVVTDPMGHLLAFFAGAVGDDQHWPTPARRWVRATCSRASSSRCRCSCCSASAVMTSANNFLVVYLGLELMSLSLYA
jgi:NADH-quinone oxidoreductase subunit N